MKTLVSWSSGKDSAWMVHALRQRGDVVVGALLFANFLTVSGAAAGIQAWVGSFRLTQVELILALLAIYLVLGCLLDASAMMLLTVPLFLPIVLGAGIEREGGFRRASLPDPQGSAVRERARSLRRGPDIELQSGQHRHG